jgi:hypothetical protein
MSSCRWVQISGYLAAASKKVFNRVGTKITFFFVSKMQKFTKFPVFNLFSVPGTCRVDNIIIDIFSKINFSVQENLENVRGWL